MSRIIVNQYWLKAQVDRFLKKEVGERQSKC